MLANQKIELLAEIERQKLTRAHHLAHDVFQNLHYRVSRFALNKIFSQLKRLENSTDDQPCSHQFTQTWGLPCEHALKTLIERKERLELADVHPQWHLERNNVVATSDSPNVTPKKRMLMQVEREIYSDGPRTESFLTRLQELLDSASNPVQEPVIVVKRRGRPAGAKNKNSLTRDKSLFEYATGKKCKTCGYTGHNSRSCNKNKK